jgi:tartrate-resistant acid phosphatase type 5
MEKVLSTTSPNIKWKIVVGHHPMYSGGSRTEGYDTKAIRNTLKPMFDKHKVDMYIAGHEHSLQHISSANNLHHIISGAASEKTPARLIENSLLSASDYGFFVFSITGKELLLQTVNDQGRIIYSYTIKK